MPIIVVSNCVALLKVQSVSYVHYHACMSYLEGTNMHVCHMPIVTLDNCCPTAEGTNIHVCHARYCAR